MQFCMQHYNIIIKKHLRVAEIVVSINLKYIPRMPCNLTGFSVTRQEDFFGDEYFHVTEIVHCASAWTHKS